MSEVTVIFENDIYPQTTIHTHNHNIIADLKAELSSVINVPSNKLILRFNGIPMEDEQEVDSFYFQNYIPAFIDASVI